MSTAYSDYAEKVWANLCEDMKQRLYGYPTPINSLQQVKDWAYCVAEAGEVSDFWLGEVNDRDGIAETLKTDLRARWQEYTDTNSLNEWHMKTEKAVKKCPDYCPGELGSAESGSDAKAVPPAVKMPKI